MNIDLIKKEITESYQQQMALRKEKKGINYEKQIQKIYTVVLKNGCVGIDVGGNRGSHTIGMCREVLPLGKVIVFEGNPDMAKILESNIKKNNLDPYCEINSMAVSNYDGETEFVLALDDPGYSGIKQRVYDQPNMQTQKIRVPCCKLDTILQDLDRCDFIKIDVEGGEYDVLQGCSNLINKHNPVVTFECGIKSYGAYNVKPENIADFFLQKNYVIYDVIGNQLTTKEIFIHSDKTPGLWDYLAITEKYPFRSKIVNAIKL